MTSLKPYPSYRYSSQEWLDKTPSHWCILKLKHAGISVFGGATPRSDDHANWDGDIVWVTPEDVSRTDRIRSSKRTLTTTGLDSCSARLAPEGSVVLNSRAPIGNVAVAQVPLATNQGCKALVPNRSRLMSRYLFRLLSAAKEELQSRGTGTTFQELSTSDVSAFEAPVPPLEEQRAIADFLDVMDARISRYIAAKHRMIALLEEQKQAIIKQAVTRGLDPDVPLKPSGVEWLGDIPAHWELKSVSSLTTMLQTGPFGSQLPASDYIDGGIPLINPSHIGDGTIIPSGSVAVSEITGERLSRHRFLENDIVLARRGEIGRCAVISSYEEGWLCGTGSILIRPNRAKILPEFLQLVLSNSSLADWLILESAGATMSNLNTSLVGLIRLGVPPIAEQVAIMTWSHQIQNRIKVGIRSVQAQIQTVGEYRTRLISDVVTGMLDVRGVELAAVEEYVDAGIEGMLDDEASDATEESEEESNGSPLG